jgi:hypothetical protein
MEDLKKLVKLVLLTGDIKGEKPVSLLVISKSGNGKTELISSFNKRTCSFMTDLTYFGLISKLEENKRIKHLIIPDFIKITQKKRSTSDNLVSLLNALLEEGVGEIRIYNRNADLKKRTLGLITATTKASFSQNKDAWESFGFVQRMLLVSYDYSDETIEKIIDSINKEEYIKTKTERIDLFGEDVKSEAKFNKQLNKYVDKNFRTLKHLQTLCKAHALYRNANNVGQEDIDEIIRLTKYMNLKYNKI